jgi:integrase
VAVVARKRKHSTVYYVATTWSGGQDWERIGTDKREAERIDALYLKQVKAGTFRPKQVTEAAAVKVYAAAWFQKRTNRNKASDKVLFGTHVLGLTDFANMAMRDVRPRHILDVIDRLRAAGALSEKSITLALGLVRVMFRDAVIDEVVGVSPYVVPRGKLSRQGETRQPYAREEAAALVGPAVGEREQVWNTLAFYTGARCGEICGLRWSDWDERPSPLTALRIERQYDGQTTKTGRARIVAVHPRLALLLAAWRARWSLYYLRRPGPNDPIVPAPQREIRHQTKSSAYKAWVRSCSKVGVVNRTVHSTRHTFITLALRGGAAEGTVLRLTHNPSGKIIDVYNHRAWLEFCEAVMLLDLPGLDAPLDATPASLGDSGSSSWTRSKGATGNRENSENEASSGGSENPDESEKGPRRGALLDARQAETGLAFERPPCAEPADIEGLTAAAERVLGRVAVRMVTVVRRRKGSSRAG